MNGFMMTGAIILSVLAVLIIIAVTMQEGTQGGMSAFTGDAEERLGRNFGRTNDAKLSKFTKYACGVFFVLTVVVTAITIYTK